MDTSSVQTSGAANVTSSLTAGSTPLSDANQAQDRFLKLLVAQLNNQDPMNPMDNAQMTSQMAQINTVTGINQLNETMKNMASQFLSAQILQGASLVGHDVLMPGNSMALHNGTAVGAFDLDSNADKVVVTVTTPGGQVLEQQNLGSLNAGRQNFSWDASQYTGKDVRFTVSASAGTQPVKATTWSRDTIVSVGNDSGQMNLQLMSGANVKQDSVSTIF